MVVEFEIVTVLIFGTKVIVAVVINMVSILH